MRDPVNANQAPRQNRNGHLCPPWCTIDHHRTVPILDGPIAHHMGARARFELAGTEQQGKPADELGVRPFHSDHDEAPYVLVSGYRFGDHDSEPRLRPQPCEAQKLASLIEMLADATPAQHRELAAAIRKAATDITDAADPEAWAFE